MGETVMRHLFAAAALLALSLPAPALANYVYLHTEGEYSLQLPEAPTGNTIWAGDANIPYLHNLPKYGSLGETAVFSRQDPNTGDHFDVTITFLKADRDFLLSLKKEDMMATLENEFDDYALSDRKLGYSAGSDTLKWATLAGFSTDKANKPIYVAAHYLTGTSTLTMVKAVYTFQNQTYNNYYIDLVKSIRFAGK